MNYFAYGYNMGAREMSPLLSRRSRRLPAWLKGHALVFDNQSLTDRRIGFANVRKRNGAVVHGVLYTDLSERAFRSLDRNEDVPRSYIQKVLAVETDEGPVRAAVYVGNPARRRAGLRPSRHYLDRLLKGRDLLPAPYSKKIRSVRTAPPRPPTA